MVGLEGVEGSENPVEVQQTSNTQEQAGGEDANGKKEQKRWCKRM